MTSSCCNSNVTVTYEGGVSFMVCENCKRPCHVKFYGDNKMDNDSFECTQCKQSFHNSVYCGGLCRSCYESAAEKRLEYRELVKQYAGQIFVGVRSSGNTINITEIVECSHELATEVLASLKQKEGE